MEIEHAGKQYRASQDTDIPPKATDRRIEAWDM